MQEEVVAELRRQFAHVALFFWNGLAGADVGVVWRPRAFLPQKFAILNCDDRTPCGTSGSGGGNSSVGAGAGSSDYTLPNVPALIQRMLAVADGLIADVVIY